MTPRPFLRDGLTLTLHDAGGTGVPLLLQHGLTGSAAQVADLLPAPPGFRALTLDCRGHGASAAGDPAALSLATFAADVTAVLEGLGEPAVLGGISMGAEIALRIAAARPELVRALVLIRPAWGWAEAGVPDNLAPNREVGALIASQSPEAARADFFASATAARLTAKSQDNLASLIGMFSREPRAVTAALLTRIAAEPGGLSLARLAALRLPVLVIGCGQDAIHPLPLARDLAARIEGARFVEVTAKGEDRSRHLAEVRSALSGFLAELTPEVAA